MTVVMGVRLHQDELPEPEILQNRDNFSSPRGLTSIRKTVCPADVHFYPQASFGKAR